MNTSEKIASVVAQFLAADREEDRKRIAELERDFARALVREREANERTGAAIHRVQSLENGAEWERKDVSATIDGLNKQLDELNEKCAALVVEKEVARGELVKLREERDAAKNFWFTASTDKAPSMRIDPDMSKMPPMGATLVVKLDPGMSISIARDISFYSFRRDQLVGFLVETPAAKQEEQGPWVVWDVEDPKWRMRDAWVYTISGEGFDSEEEAQKIIDDFGRGGKKMRVITLAEARAIEAKR